LLDSLNAGPEAAGAVRGLRRDLVEQLLHHLLARELLLFIHQSAIAHQRDHLASAVQRISPGERDQLLCHRLDFLGFGQSRLDLAVLKERLAKIPAKRQTVFSIAAKLSAADQMAAHYVLKST